MEIELKSKKKPVMERRIVLLKDFLKEEMSSCSSNGFKSFPRKTCCTYSIRHLVEMDLKSRDLTKNPSFPKNHHLLRNKSSSTTATSTTISALQKASVAVINVVKYLTFSSSSSSKLSSLSSSSSSSRKQGNSLSRSVSKKLKSKSFWRKNNSEKNNRKVEKEIIKDAGRVKDIMKWKSFRDLQKRSSSSLSIQTITTTTNTIYSWSPSSSDSECDTHDNHHSREFKSYKQKKDTDSSDLHCSSSISVSTGISISECPADDSSDNKLNQKCTSTNQEIVVEEDEEEISIQKGDLRGEQGHQYGKVQQFNSPVSTLDFPSEEDDEETSSSSSPSLFQSSLANMEKSKKNLMQKIRRFEGLGQLDPINLSKRIASFEAILSHDSLESPSDSYASSIFTSSSHVISTVSEQQEEEEEEDEEEDQMSKAEEKAKNLFQCTIKETARNEENLKSVNSIEDLLLLDFFKDEIMERTTDERVVVSKRSEEKLDNELLRLAKNWMNGQCDPLDWGLQDSRKVHVKEMEKGGQWSISNEDIVFEMEIMIAGSLMDEVLAELLS
ncbi:suppressor protein SRP40-like [Papaver somniferum]|uniref:suppressor protein SRP40-like n=1 Tax=Papaver somniferum TaxID=3469 RepID=UPI000E6F9421|nr:suppressor protein SRP40-like [Papaver somniferum]